MQSRARASAEQFAALIEFMETHGDIARPQQGAQGRIRAERLWQDLGQLLNSFGGGVTRPTEKWKKVWADWKTKTKKKVTTINKETNATGGGPSSRSTLSALEHRVLGVMGFSAVAGQSQVTVEGGFQVPLSERLMETSSANSEIILDIISPSPLAAGPSSRAIEDPMTSGSVIRNLPRASPSREAQQPAPPVGGGAERTLSPAPATSPLASITTTPRRRRLLRARRRLTPFEEATGQFVAVEQRRLRMEETREKNLHESTMQKLQLEARKLEMEENRTSVLKSLSDNLANLPYKICELLRPESQISTDVLSTTP